MELLNLRSSSLFIKNHIRFDCRVMRRTITEAFYVDDKRHGPHTTYITQTGDFRSCDNRNNADRVAVEHYFYGKRHGSIVMHESGKLITRFYYFHDKLHGIRQTWWINGQLRQRDACWLGKPCGSYEQWYDNGQPCHRGKHSNEHIHGKYESWFRNGAPCERSNYNTTGMLEGIKEIWGSDNQINYLSLYSNDSELIAFIRDGKKIWTQIGRIEIGGKCYIYEPSDPPKLTSISSRQPG